MHSSADSLEARFAAWSQSRRFVVAVPGISSRQPLPPGADRAAVSRSPGRRASLPASPSAPGRWQRLLACLRAVVARLRTPGHRGR